MMEKQEWHSWKCRCGCLNNKGNANCGRCGGMRGSDSMLYGSNGYIEQYGVWESHEKAKNQPLVNNLPPNRGVITIQ